MTKSIFLLFCCLILGTNALILNATISLENEETNLAAAITYGQYLFYGTNNSPAKIVRIDTATFTRVDSLTLNFDYIRCATINGSYGYFATKNATTNGVIVVVDLNSFQVVDSFSLKVSGYAFYNLNIVTAMVVNNTAWFGSSDGIVFPVNLKTKIYNEFNAGYSPFMAMVSYDANRYFLTTNYLVRVSTIQGVGVNGTVFIPGYNLQTATSYNNFAYIGGQDNITIIDLSAMSVVGTVPLSVVNGLRTCVAQNENAFFANSDSILHYDMSTNTKIQTLTLGVSDITTSVANSNYVYFGTKNGTVYKVDTNMDCLYAVGGVLQHNQSRYVYYENCTVECAAGIITCLYGNLSGNLDYRFTSCSSDCPCNTQFGLIYGNVDVYSSPSVCGGSCDTAVGVLYCDNGNLTGDLDYNYLNCSSYDGCPCDNAVGGSLYSGQSRNVYPSSSSPCTSNCTMGQISCHNGTLTGNLSYLYTNCTSDNICSCPNALGGLLNNGQARGVYSSASSNCTTKCRRGTIQCIDGKLTGDTSFGYLRCEECKSLQSPINATLNGTNSVVTILFPAAPNVTISYSVATNSSAEYRDPNVDAPGVFEGTTFFISFFENDVETHFPPNGTFLEISTGSPTTAHLYYFDMETNKWTENCFLPELISQTTIRVELCHATQYAIFSISIGDISSISPSGDLTVVAIVIVVLVIVIGILTGALLYYRRKRNNFRKDSIEMSLNPSFNEIKEVKVLFKLGNGNFGEVYKGEWKGTFVALKKLKATNAEQYEEFVKESTMLSKFSHPNVVQFLGIYVNEEGEKYIVTEFMSKGDLLSLLRNDTNIDSQTLLQMARQAAAGMVYLEDRSIVHRDLALRNFLVMSSEEKSYIIKVSDFGLSRAVDENNYYQKEGAQLPVKWSAPESLKYGKFSTKSDVWSFGICLWELFSIGETPYFTMSNAEAAEKVSQGYRMPQPKDCPDEVYKLMLSCWKEDPQERPSFIEILKEIEDITPKEQPKASVNLEESKEENTESVYN